MKKLFLLIILSTGLGYHCFSQQVKSFTRDTVLYIEEVKKFSNNYVSEKDKPLYEQFYTFWNSGRFTWEEMSEIVDISNLLIKRNGRPSPDFAEFFELMIFSETDSLHAAKANFTDWKKILTHYLENKDSPFRISQQLLELTLNLFKENVLFKTPTSIWKSIQSNYSFDYNQGEPRVVFKDIDLYCFAKRDSICIEKTGGYLNPSDFQWHGRNGKVTWERAGMNKDSVYAELSGYQISLRKVEYKADSVMFTYKKYFKTPMEGRLDDQVMLITNASSALYPKFFSYQNRYVLPDLFKGIEYTGGLSMQGARLVGTGIEGEPARLDISEKDTLRMVLRANQFLISTNSISSPNVRMTMFLETDSIYHPDLVFSYQEKNDLFRFTKSNTYISEGPYSNSYHKMSMNFDELSWRRGLREIAFKPMTGSSLGSATFESDDFFNYVFWEELQGMNNIHPLVALWQYSKGIRLEQFPVPNYANYLGIDESQVRHQLMLLSRFGFIYYNDVTDMIRINKKLFYFLDASVGKTDYDVIYFTSRIQAPNENARLSLDNFDLHIFGVQNIFLSDSQNIVLNPVKNEIILKKNRNFIFDGSVQAGLFTFYGANFFFDYPGFKLDLTRIDSLKFQIQTDEKDNYGSAAVRSIKNMVELATGELLLDNPSNKSGLKKYPEYPVFSSNDEAYIYYDNPNIQNGVYSRDQVFFRVNPFSIDSLDNFTREGMKLKGTFESNGMMPPLEQVLTVREDFSLGFQYKTPDQGMPVYNGAGTFFNTIEMSNDGLHGSGQLEYLTSVTRSDDFVFHPDSLMTQSREFMNNKQTAGVTFPNVQSSKNSIKWLTKQDKFHAGMTDTPFAMFNDTALLAGNLLLQPSGLSGDGKLTLMYALMESDLYNFKADQISSDTANFKLKNPQSENLAFKTDSINLNIDLLQKRGQFKSNDDFTLVEFPDTRYISYMDFFSWDMNKEILEMGANRKVEQGKSVDGLIGPRYISTLVKQDSLSWVSGYTLFDYKNAVLNALEVPYIQVADSRIFPKEGDITVERNAVIRQLNEAQILTDYTNEYYRLYNGAINITSRKDYKGSADYDYIDETDKSQVIHFNSLMADTSGHTKGKGSVIVADSFRLSPFFDFQGEVRLNALDPYLTFDGAARLVHDCKIGKSWLKFEAVINPDSIFIPVLSNPVDMNLNKIFAGSMITRDSTHVFSTFLSPRKDYFDAYLSNASGFLRYDKYDQHYEISTAEKLLDPNVPANYLRLETDSCRVYSEGVVNFEVDFGQLKMVTVGTSENNLITGKYETNVMMSLDFFFSPDALTLFGNDLESETTLKAVDLRGPSFIMALNNFIGIDKAKKMTDELSLLGTYKEIPPEFNKSMILSNIRLKWDQDSRSFIYHGPVGIVRMGNVPINKNVETYIQIIKRSSGDLLDIYFKINDAKWYYFGYNPGSMQVTSSNRNFNDVVNSIKDSDRKLKTRANEKEYIYSLAPDRRAELFLRRYIDIEEAEAAASR